MADQDDYLDSLLRPDAATADEVKYCGLAVRERAVDSAELERREQEFLSRPLLPIPFFNEHNELEPLSKEDRAHLRDLGITEDEYAILCTEG